MGRDCVQSSTFGSIEELKGMEKVLGLMRQSETLLDWLACFAAKWLTFTHQYHSQCRLKKPLQCHNIAPNLANRATLISEREPELSLPFHR